jgi:hypothetical protein
MNIPTDPIQSIIRDEIIPDVLSDLSTIAKSCAKHEKGGNITIAINLRHKEGRLKIAAVVKSKRPLSLSRDESEKSQPVELASIDLAEDEGQERIPGA